MSEAKRNECTSPPTCSAVDNSFTSVLWRRLSVDFRMPMGWSMETMERNFRKIVEQTLADSPPNKEVGTIIGEVREQKNLS